MLLDKDEAISLILSFSQSNEVSGKVKLNKLLARLNLFMIPIDIEFSLNKFGSHSTDIEVKEGTEYYEPFEYTYEQKTCTGLRLTLCVISYLIPPFN